MQVRKERISSKYKKVSFIRSSQLLMEHGYMGFAQSSVCSFGTLNADFRFVVDFPQSNFLSAYPPQDGAVFPVLTLPVASPLSLVLL